MVKRNYRKSSKKIQPAVMKFNFVIPVEDTKQSAYIDLSQCASILNRRFYRQGLNWAVAGFKILSPIPGPGGAVTGQVSINKLPNTWVMSNSWEKGFRAWQKMNNEALSESPSVKPKFLDFKIYANKDHHGLGYGDNLLPHSAATLADPISQASPGEWESSKYIIPDTTSATGGIQNREVIAVGSSYPGSGASGLGAVSLIEGYAASRGLPNILDPNTPDDAADADGATPENWLTALFNEGTQQDDQVISDMIAENNEAPYPFENDGSGNTDTMYPGGANQLSSMEIHSQEYVTSTTVGSTTRFSGGNFPCGLVEIQTLFSEKTSCILEVTLVPGNHRGYLAESMTEM